ncbi:MAG: aminotransferase class I/II-fold pyridoxal phosphate-dependent enzyme [Gemmatimonadaceae bacterium]
MQLDTIAVHAGHTPDPATGAVAPPLYLSTTFLRSSDGSYASGYKYSRELAPNRSALEAALAALDGGAEAAAFSSGQAATAAVFQSLRPGDHVICPSAVYYGTLKLLSEVFGPWGLEYSVVDSTDLDAVRKAVRPRTALIWAETPSNPTLAITDLSGIVEIARAAGARTVVDNTWATAVGQRALALGADLVMYSTTKYYGGHSDTLSGALVTREADDFWSRVRLMQGSVGAVAAPFDCWLVSRGIASLPCRLRQHTASATRVAEFLSTHPKVEATHYPGLPSHPGHAIAARQMSLFGGMVSVQPRGSAADALALASRLRLFTQATSLGAVESLVEHRKSVEGPESATPDNLLRISVGLENADDLIEDLRQALG